MRPMGMAGRGRPLPMLVGLTTNAQETRMTEELLSRAPYFAMYYLSFRNALGFSTLSPGYRLLLNPKVHFFALPFNGNIFAP